MNDLKPPICDCINCQGKVMERGLFVFDGVDIQSDDFSHDVRITFSGDMLPGHYAKYGEWLTRVLNAVTALETPEKPQCRKCGGEHWVGQCTLPP